MLTNLTWGILLFAGIIISVIEGALEDSKHYKEKSKNDFDYINYKNWRM